MKLINKLERKFGKYAISNLSIFIIGSYIIGYLFQLISPELLSALTLNPYRIMHGEVWRVISWVLVPPSELNFFTIIMLFFYYSIGTTLERTWGAFRYNLYIFSGILMTIIGAFVLYFVYAGFVMPNDIDYLRSLEESSKETLQLILSQYGVNSTTGYIDLFYSDLFSRFSTYYINLSIFLAFAASYPNMQVMLYFVIPIKIKWLAYLNVVLLVVDMVNTNWAGRVAIIISLLNFIIFFFATRNQYRVSPGEVHRRRTYSKQVHTARRITKHKCAVCGRTDEEDEQLEFRFCSKCKGNYEYCQNHLFTHEHVK